ncbi:hypothetical protein [Paenibacillus polymyxa]|uniref:Uncharacterized protein n=1 Tax=Paenibacillus polymyxa (strain SC2) TaxID=886882 RepID=A0A0D5ZCB2_PAEPS|nr:hypothetical protein [Paenibacillus polymyxa]AKA44375.1 hypothetical protein PPSC2_27170 [Paenibacillus polymyxa SC2]WPQ59582.1 hypothetical protein SKN87_28370 [Paenibacillus polymyxa]
MKAKTIPTSLTCTVCGDVKTIHRIIGRQREVDHIKHLYCHKCYCRTAHMEKHKHWAYLEKLRYTKDFNLNKSLKRANYICNKIVDDKGEVVGLTLHLSERRSRLLVTYEEVLSLIDDGMVFDNVEYDPSSETYCLIADREDIHYTQLSHKCYAVSPDMIDRLGDYFCGNLFADTSNEERACM